MQPSASSEEPEAAVDVDAAPALQADPRQDAAAPPIAAIPAEIAREIPSETPDEEEENSLRTPGVLSAAGRMFSNAGPVSLPVKAMGKAFRALHHVDYRMLWFGALLSNIGSWMENVAKQWLIFDLSQSANWLGINAFCNSVPTLIMLPLAGVLADRLDRRYTLIVVNVLMAGTALILGTLFYLGQLAVWHIICVSILAGLLNGVMMPASQSLLPMLVSEDDLANAVALNSMQFNLSRAIGPAIGGFILVKLGATWSFGLNVLSFGAMIYAVLAMRNVPRTRKVHESVGRSFQTGLRYLRHRPDILSMEVMVFLAGFFVAPLLTLLPALVQEVYAKGASAYSTLLSAFGIGAVLGAIMLAANSHRRPSPQRALPVLLMVAVCELLIGLAPYYPLTVCLVLLCGAGFVGSMNRLFAAILSSTPNSVRGRISSLHAMCFIAGVPLGSLLAGYLASTLGVRFAFGLYGGGLLISVAAAGGYFRRALAKQALR